MDHDDGYFMKARQSGASGPPKRLTAFGTRKITHATDWARFQYMGFAADMFAV
jgi:hypothetical protein